jgi:Xaa-Pro aminopeptidase
MITIEEYKKRRQALSQQLPSNAVALIPAASEPLRNGDAHYRFRQDSDFYYLTGFNEPDALLVICSGGAGESVLFNRPRNEAEEQWTGPRLGQEDANAVLGVDFAFPLSRLDEMLPQLLAGKSLVYYPLGRSSQWEARFRETWFRVKNNARRGLASLEGFYDSSCLLGEMRLFKSDAELALMREAARVTTAGHRRAMRACSALTHEYQLEAELVYEFTRQGCRDVAYDSIVASGPAACVLHYTENNQLLRPNALILVDAGAEYQNYAADVTRTYPKNGTFSHEQRQIYELVYLAQQAAIAAVQPGCRFEQIQAIVVRTLTEGLVDLGILTGEVDGLIEQGAYRSMYMHQSSHWLGLDVHDCGNYRVNGESRRLAPNMVLTVEPGLYFHHDLQTVASRWRGIGVRIEDDIRVTESGHENLTASLPAAASDIEVLVRGE